MLSFPQVRIKRKKMDFLKAEIERKKRLIAEKSVIAGPEKKYFKRGDLAEKEKEEYLKRHAMPSTDAEKVKEIKEAKKEAKKALVGKSDADEGETDDGEKGPEMDRREVIRRLRDRMEPILLFGETLSEACDRLRQVEIDAPEIQSGLTNDFQEARDRVDQVYLQTMLKDGAASEPGTSAGSSDPGGSDTKKGGGGEDRLFDSKNTYDDLLDMANDLDKGDFAHDCKVVMEFLRVMLRLWAQELQARDGDVKASVKGKMEETTYAQTRAYLKPLLRMLKKQTLSDEIRDSLAKLVKETLQRNYIASHERYMEMAIGNAPWPIGVTNAGIHARPARENIFSKHVAHVLNDETQRKFIQGLKRLLTKCQQYYPTDPSRSVDFVKGKAKVQE